MTRQISRSLAGSESIYTKCPGTGISFSLRERWRWYTHLAVHDNVETNRYAIRSGSP